MARGAGGPWTADEMAKLQRWVDGRRVSDADRLVLQDMLPGRGVHGIVRKISVLRVAAGAKRIYAGRPVPRPVEKRVAMVPVGDPMTIGRTVDEIAVKSALGIRRIEDVDHQWRLVAELRASDTTWRTIGGVWPHALKTRLSRDIDAGRIVSVSQRFTDGTRRQYLKLAGHAPAAVPTSQPASGEAA
jgi:hypothetical protein